MAKKLTQLILILVFTTLYFSCNNDSTNPVSNSDPVNYVVTNTFTRSTNKGIPNTDTLIIETSGSMISLKFSLDTILNIDGNQKLDVVLVHSNIADTLVKQFMNPTIPSYSFQNLIFSDTVTNAIQPGSTSYSGTYKPYSPLSVFNGQSLLGQWYLIISYPTLSRAGVIKSWGVTISYNTPNPPTSNVFPLTVGNYWVFTVDTGTVQNVFQQTLDINDETTIRGKQVFKWQWQNDSRYWYFRNESDGMWWYGFYNGTYLDTVTPPYIWWKYPISLNESYITKQFVSMGTDTMTCMDLNSTFASYSGCINYYGRSSAKLDVNNDKINSPLFFNPISSIYGNFYLKPSIGYIGNEITNTGRFYRYRLIQYNIQ